MPGFIQNCPPEYIPQNRIQFLALKKFLIQDMKQFFWILQGQSYECYGHAFLNHNNLIILSLH